MRENVSSILIGLTLLFGCDDPTEFEALERGGTTSERLGGGSMAISPEGPTSELPAGPGKRFESEVEEPGVTDPEAASIAPGAGEDAGTEDRDPRDGATDDLTNPPETAEGFGCPSDKKCHNHCKSVDYDGGYCEGLFDLKCKCYDR